MRNDLQCNSFFVNDNVTFRHARASTNVKIEYAKIIMILIKAISIEKCYFCK